MLPELDSASPHGSDFDKACPAALRDAERTLLSACGDRAARLKVSGGPVGVALSGGGIRSATFALGVFQALAKARLLGCVDYLSTVSGGGYFGSFLGRLYARSYVRHPRDVEDFLASDVPEKSESGTDAAAQTRERARSEILDWLRENGRYLAPRGAGDLLLAGAAMLRNWIAVHVVLGVTLLAVFILAQGPRFLNRRAPDWVTWLAASGGALGELPFSGSLVWWSPWVIVAVPPALVAIACGWAYWLILDEQADTRRWISIIAAALAIAIVVYASIGLTSRAGIRTLGLGTAALAVLATLLSWLARRQSLDKVDSRHRLSSWLKFWLLLTVAAFAFGAIDSLGQTLYAVWSQGLGGPWLGAIIGGIVAATAFVRHLVVLLGTTSEGRRPRLPLAITAGIAAFIVTSVLLVSLDALAHAVTWGFGPPGGLAQRSHWAWLAGLWTAALLTIAVGQTFSFLNRSSHHTLYSHRLIRAYLGASNPLRWENARKPVITPIAEDDSSLGSYWRTARGASPDPTMFEKGAPVHLINVTINETVRGRSQIQEQDRKGTSMALGPAGMSVGARHHVVFPPPKPDDSNDAGTQVYPIRKSGGFRVFEYPVPPRDWKSEEWEQLTLGQWAAISGAAFSTGVGWRTSLGLSLLSGLGNVRLGYWWNSGVEPARREGAVQLSKSRWVGQGLRFVFPIQVRLIGEFLARFVGVADRYWYLSDGGHFENTGGYELIRRRLPLIIIVDAEADPDYGFEGLANLVRKARIDFHAKVTFLTAPGDAIVESPQYRALFGSLADVKPRASESSGPRLSRAHCALARIEYPNSRSSSWLLYVKPSLTGDEPADVLEYAAKHEPFPQQTTGDQFFDEAQWESYRSLGEHIGESIFRTQPPSGELEGVDNFSLSLFGFGAGAGRARAESGQQEQPARLFNKCENES